MKNGRHSVVGAGTFIALPLCVLLIAGCSKPETPAAAPSGQASETGGSGGGPGGGRPGGGPGGGRGGPVAENASGAEIYQAKCNCHGSGGKGGKAPVLTGVSGDSDAKLTTTIHDGKQKMPAFGSQLSDAQIKKVVAYIKAFK